MIKFINVVKFIWDSLKNLKIQFCLFCTLIAIYALYESVVAYGIKILLDNFENANDSQFVANLYNAGLQIVLIVVFFEIINKSSYFLLKIKIIPYLYKGIVGNVYNRILFKNYSFFNKILSGNIVTKIDDLGNSVCNILSNFLDNIINRILIILSCIISIFFVNKLCGSIVTILVVIFLTIGIYLLQIIMIRSKKYAESHSILIGKMLNSTLNILSIKLFNGTNTENKDLEYFLKNNRGFQEELQIANFYLFALLGFLFVLTILSILPVIINQRISGDLTIGDISLIISLSLSISINAWDLAYFSFNFFESYGKLFRALDVLKLDHNIKLLSENDKLDKNTNYPNDVNKIKNEIIFENVSLDYDGDGPQEKSLCDLSIKILGNQKVAIVGESGSGKSTFLSLLMKLYKTDTGNIFIDGKDIYDFSDKDFYDQLSFVPQNIILFNRTIKDNILYSKVDATFEEVISAAKNAQIHDYIMTLPDQYETVVEEGGTNISGGQKQRIALARAFLKDAPILIIDEGLSALDEVTKSKIENYLNEFMKNKTCFIITHDLTFLNKVDRVLFFHNGEIIADGKYEELLEKDERFKRFAKRSD